MLGALLTIGCLIIPASGVYAKEKSRGVDANDPTYRLYQLLDTSYAGKLSDFYLLADTLKDPTNPQQELQHVLRAEYDKSRFFGRFRIYVRSVSRPTAEQLKTYTPKQIYDFGGSDSEKFEKIESGPFGKTGDLYLRSTDDRPLASAPVTDEIQKQYDFFVVQYLLPALQKK